MKNREGFDIAGAYVGMTAELRAAKDRMQLHVKQSDLRDRFAGQAMQAVLSHSGADEETIMDEVADFAYDMARSMLDARRRCAEVAAYPHGKPRDPKLDTPRGES